METDQLSKRRKTANEMVKIQKALSTVHHVYQLLKPSPSHVHPNLLSMLIVRLCSWIFPWNSVISVRSDGSHESFPRSCSPGYRPFLMSDCDPLDAHCRKSKTDPIAPMLPPNHNLTSEVIIHCHSAKSPKLPTQNVPVLMVVQLNGTEWRRTKRTQPRVWMRLSWCSCCCRHSSLSMTVCMLNLSVFGPRVSDVDVTEFHVVSLSVTYLVQATAWSRLLLLRISVVVKSSRFCFCCVSANLSIRELIFIRKWEN